MESYFKNRLTFAVFLILYIFLSQTASVFLLSLILLTVIYACIVVSEDVFFGILASIAVILQIFYIDNSFFVIAAKIASMLSGACFGICFLCKLKFDSTLAIMSGVNLLTFLSWIWYENISSQTMVINTFLDNLFLYVEKALNDILSDKEFMSYFESVLRQQGYVSADNVYVMVSDFITGLKSLNTVLVPSILIIICTLFCFVCIQICKSVLSHLGRDVSHLTRFEELRIDSLSMWIFLISSLFSDIGDFSLTSVFFSNIMVLIWAAAFLCGISVVVYYIKYNIRSSFKKIMISAVFILAMVAIFDTMSTFLTIVGIVDTFWNLRALVRR